MGVAAIPAVEMFTIHITGSDLIKTPSAKKTEFFPVGKVKGKHQAKLYQTYRKVNVGLATTPGAKNGFVAGELKSLNLSDFQAFWQGFGCQVT